MLVKTAPPYSGTEYQSPIRIAVLGSTGSIGCSTLEIVRAFPEKFQVVALAANRRVSELLNQVEEFAPEYAAVVNEQAYSEFRKGMRGDCRTFCGSEALSELAMLPEVDVVVAAVVGMAGLPSVLAALEAGKRVALANKESLVAGGNLIEAVLKSGQGELLPVDSEHSALFQALQGEYREDIDRLVLTASGGPFRNTPSAEFPALTPEQAVTHPNWSMGRKISVDSATLMNKALELIEASWLFLLPEERIDVVVHPQSIVHSLVSFVDGSCIAQLSQPDMKGPIAYALGYGSPRLPQVVSALDLVQAGRLDFEQPDEARFPALGLAREALRVGGTAPLVLNLANEMAVERFLQGDLRFDEIFAFNEMALGKASSRDCGSLGELLEYERSLRLQLDDELKQMGDLGKGTSRTSF